MAQQGGPTDVDDGGDQGYHYEGKDVNSSYPVQVHLDLHPNRPEGLEPPGGNPTGGTGDEGSAHVLVYVLVPLGALVFIAALSFLVVFILKKSKLDKLRHHLMPLYNFDPAEEEGDWESELLEEDKEQQVALHIRSPSLDGAKLKFTDHQDL